MLVDGYSLGAIAEALTATNAALPANRRVTRDSLETHRRKHFPLELGASSLWRRLLESRAEAEVLTYNEGVANLVTPRIYLETMLIKAYGGVISEAAEITADQGLSAARELARLAAADEATERMAKIVAT
jgi:hypothetical protein